MNSTSRKYALERLKTASSRWIRAVESREEPLEYPPLPFTYDVELDRDLGRDPLWRTLWELERNLHRVSAEGIVGSWQGKSWPWWANKINVLTTYDGLQGSGLFLAYYEDDGTHSGMQVSMPGHSDPFVLRFDQDGRPPQIVLPILEDLLGQWRELRGSQLLVGFGRTKKRSGRNPPPQASNSARAQAAAKEKAAARERARRLYDAWHGGGYLTKAELAKAFEMEELAATRMLDAERKRRERME
jgi:hypothetical protein